MLAERYGWTVINFSEILADTIQQQANEKKHTPCNPDGGKIHLSEEELEAFYKGQGIEMHHLWPIVAN